MAHEVRRAPAAGLGDQSDSVFVVMSMGLGPGCIHYERNGRRVQRDADGTYREVRRAGLLRRWRFVEGR